MEWAARRNCNSKNFELFQEHIRQILAYLAYSTVTNCKLIVGTIQQHIVTAEHQK